MMRTFDDNVLHGAPLVVMLNPDFALEFSLFITKDEDPYLQHVTRASFQERYPDFSAQAWRSSKVLGQQRLTTGLYVVVGHTVTAFPPERFRAKDHLTLPFQDTHVEFEP
jgi:hypothetical protein